MRTVNLSYAVDYLHEAFLKGKISREDKEYLVEFVYCYMIYAGMVNRISDETWESEKLAHEEVLDGLIFDRQVWAAGKVPRVSEGG